MDYAIEVRAVHHKDEIKVTKTLCEALNEQIAIAHKNDKILISFSAISYLSGIAVFGAR